MNKRTLSVFSAGVIAGAFALGFNFLLRLAEFAAFPPESALSFFLKIVPASVEEPMVQRFGGLAGQIGLAVATIIAGVVYGLFAVIFDKFLARRLVSRSLSKFEALMVFALVPWLAFGLLVFPLAGDSVFGIGSTFASSSGVFIFPLSFLLVQGVFILVFSSRYRLDQSRFGGKSVRQRELTEGSRRDFLEKGTIGALALIAGVIGLSNLEAFFAPQIQPTGGSSPIDLSGAPPIFSDPRLTDLVDSEVTPNASFYQVDIDVFSPSVNASMWSLMVDGLVGNPKSYTLQDLQALPSTSQYTTLECVSNDINGDLVSNAKWTGLTIADLLNDAGGPLGSATYVVFYSVDGYSVGIPLSKALMPDSLMVYSMNGQLLPTAHGYPLRALVPGLYGMMSAKWVNRVSLIDSTYEGYWQTRGWENDAMVNTVSFIVTPETGSEVSLAANNGTIIVGGYAFAGDRGISKVEVSFDQGKTWQQAMLKPALSMDTWVLWAYEWTPSSQGSQLIYARATDGTGQVQTSTVTQTFPNGATGYAYIEITVGS